MDISCHGIVLSFAPLQFLSKEWFHFVEDDSLSILWPSEWTRLLTYYPDLEFHELSLKVDSKFANVPQLLSTVTVCASCYQEWSAVQSKFENSIVYIRLISNKDEDDIVDEVAS